jgi:hypothetical protein
VGQEAGTSGTNCVALTVGSADRARTGGAGVSECGPAAPVGTRRHPTRLGSGKHSDTALEGLRQLFVLKREQTE